jgi:cytochrome c biogenesis protein CcmG, thiol:disulfide interchange protein DsbE
MQRRLKTKGVVVLAISADEDEAAYHRFIKDYGVNFVTVRDPGERIQHLYGTIQIPETYVIDRQGC